MNISIQECLNLVYQQLHQTSETATLDAQVLLAHYLEKSRSWLLAHPDARIPKTQFNTIIQASSRLVHGEPLPYVIGHWEFYGLDFQLTQAVLIPRPETELIVERAINWLHLHPDRRKAVDVGTGSGCIGITLAKNIPDLHVILTDISPDAVDVAHRNANNYKLVDRLEFIQADLLDGVSESFDLICANLPYIPTTLLNTLTVGKREPTLALDGGLNGILVISRLLKQARNYLTPGGLLLLEIESSQGLEVKALAESHYPISKVQIIKDLASMDRCLQIEEPNLLLHVCPREEWLQAQQVGKFQDRSLYQDGFIHCSQPEQILDVANRFYQGIPNLVLLWLDPRKLNSKIHWEFTDGILFPHIYGPINQEAVIRVTDFKPEADGFFRSLPQPG